jgi:hypothetical protein
VSAALLLVLVWVLYAAFGPVIIPASRARHNALYVVMPRAAQAGNHLPAVRVQEVGEWMLCKLIGIAAAVPGLLLVADPVMQLYAAIMPMLLADALSRFVPALDYAGHGAEIIAAERAGITGYRAGEITRMRLLDNRAHMTDAQIDAALRRWEWLARVVCWLGGGR